MRIISQDGIKFDIEYENCHLTVNDKTFEIEAETGNPNFTPVMASYSSIDKCRKAMEMLHGEYKKFRQTKTSSGFYFAFDYPKVFQFPADNEIEV